MIGWLTAFVGTLCGLCWLSLRRGAGRKGCSFLRIDLEQGSIAGAFSKRGDAEDTLLGWGCLTFPLAMFGCFAIPFWRAGTVPWEAFLYPLGFLPFIALLAAGYDEWRRTRRGRMRSGTPAEATDWWEWPLDAFGDFVWVKDADHSGEVDYCLLGIERDGSIQEVLRGWYAASLYPHRQEVSAVLGRITGRAIWETIEGSDKGTLIWDLQRNRQGSELLAHWCQPVEE